MNAIDTTAADLVGALATVGPDYDRAWRLHLLAVAREKRAKYFDLKHQCEVDPWTMCQRIFGEMDPFGEGQCERDGFEERDLAREEWIEALAELSEAKR